MAGVHPTLAGVAVALLIPVFTPERQQVEQTVELVRAFRQSPNSQYARAATRGLRESISINERLQTDVGPYVSFVVLPLFALANAGVRLDQRDPVRGGALAADLGHRRGPGGRKADRHHRRRPRSCAHRHRAAGAGADAAPRSPAARRCPESVSPSRFSSSTSRSTIRSSRTRPGSGCWSRRWSRSLLGWAIFRITDWVSPPEPVGLKLVRPVDPDRDHIRGDPTRR